MTDRPDPHAPTVLMAPRRRRWWPWLLLAPLVLATAAVFAAPWLTCRSLNGRAPFPAGDLVVRGARLGGQPPTAMVVATCDPAVFRAICEGASGRWLPPVLLADEQHAWGTFADAPAVSWRLDLVRGAGVPSVVARIPSAVAERVVAERLAAERSPMSHVAIRAFSLVGEPAGIDAMAWRLALAGSASLQWGQQALPLAIDDVQLDGRSRLGDATGDGRPVSAEVEVKVLRGTAPLLGDLAPLLPILQKQANQRLGHEMPGALVPVWWPSATRWDLQTVPSAMAEF